MWNTSKAFSIGKDSMRIAKPSFRQTKPLQGMQQIGYIQSKTTLSPKVNRGQKNNPKKLVDSLNTGMIFEEFWALFFYLYILEKISHSSSGKCMLKFIYQNTRLLEYNLSAKKAEGRVLRFL